MREIKLKMTPIERAKSMLPNIPTDVFDKFFAPLIINDIGWPFFSIYDSLNGTDWYRGRQEGHPIFFLSREKSKKQ
jgi:hypothetical protein